MVIIEKEYKKELCKSIMVHSKNTSIADNRFLEVFIDEYWQLPENVLMFQLGHALSVWNRIHNHNGVIDGNYNGYVIEKHKLMTPQENAEILLESINSYEDFENSYEDIIDCIVKL